MKKICKMTGIFFLTFVLACTAALFTDGAQYAQAKPKATKLKMKKKKITVIAGEKKKIQVTVKPKNAKIKWSSSKKKIAKVSKKGVVTGVKKGTAKITAKSGKKKAVCKVKVKANKAGIQSISVLNTKAVRITLTQAVSLKVSDVSIKKKSDGKGAYNRSLAIGSLTKVSGKVYDVVLSTNAEAPKDVNYIGDGDYVQVTIKKLKQNKTKEMLYSPVSKARKVYRTALVGEKYSTSIGFSQSYKGYISDVRVSGVPSGLKAKVCGQTVYLEGVPAQAKASVMTITGKDERNKKLVQKVYFYIGSENVMLSYVETEGCTILTNDNESKYFMIHTVGGSGGETYSLPGNINQLISVEEGDICFDRYVLKGNTKTYLNPGKYNVKYQVKDSKGHVSNGTLAVTAVKGVMVSGKVTAADNSGIEDADVYASFDDNSGVYYRTSLNATTYEQGETDNYSTAKKNAGEYNMIVYPSQMYDFNAYMNDANVYVNGRRIAKSNVSLNFRLPLYKVTFACGSENLSEISWYDEEDDWVGRGKTLYLKKGSYKLTGSSGIFTYTANFAVKGNGTVTVKKSNSVQPSGTLAEGNTLAASFDYDMKFFTFTPEVSGKYTFSTDWLARSIEARLYDSVTGDTIAYGSNYYYDEEEDENYNGALSMSVDLIAGKTYYLSLDVYAYATLEVGVNKVQTDN